MILTPAECLWLWRRRKGWTQRQAAEHFGIARLTYILQERGARPPQPIALRTPPSLPEQLALARRRSGLGTREVARLTGRSHVAILKAEREGNEWLRKFWEARGVLSRRASF